MKLKQEATPYFRGRLLLNRVAVPTVLPPIMKTFAAIAAHIRKAAVRRNARDKAVAEEARWQLAEDGAA